MTRVGLALPQLGEHVTARALRHFCERSEELGYSSLWAQEHLFYPHDPVSGYAGIPGRPIPEQYRSMLGVTEVLAVAAAWTERVTIGTSILVAGYHWPVEIAQRLATLDLLSGGRLVAGFSVGWSDDEHGHLGVDPRTRGRRMDELIEAVLACWGPDPVSYDGEFFTIPASDVRPKPVRQPHPPLLSGLWSPAGLRRTVAHFDIWNPARGTPAELRALIDELNQERAADQDPLRLYFRSFAQRPGQPSGECVPGVAGVTADVRAAVEADVEEVIIDCNFWTHIDSPGAWADIPDQLLPALRAASGK